jgi:hypothetical protein
MIRVSQAMKKASSRSEDTCLSGLWAWSTPAPGKH